ncbi:cytochrome C1 heme lyase [Gymnopilus junonius]|uniref:Holocytochrome c-type synthase n=1 Tax=Gymnopilus junonius TaxID=109634 RepID=A0A9P5TQU4_GYMJU|nr:cytochrome C1 heme lyase [Gymnopilus junonius]
MSSSPTTTSEAPKCPVDHSSFKNTSDTQACPVDHSTATSTSTWARFMSADSSRTSSVPLSRDREISSIPKPNDEKWVYPSEEQFFAAMARKNHNPRAADMKTIVPIHNAVNERAWTEILKWEAGRGSETCGGLKLVNFKGRPKDRSPKARLNMLLGYSAPFDRHDWVVDRCGTQMRYIIDFYTGHSSGSKENVAFYLDARPALDNWEGIKMRLENLWPWSK